MSAARLRDGRRWMGVGRSEISDSRAAGTTAARASLVGPDPKLLIVFASITHDPAAILDGVLEVAGEIPVVGCSTNGEIGPGGPRENTVVVAAIGGAGLSVSTVTTEAVSGRQRAAGAEVARCVAQAANLPHRVLLLLTDGKTPAQEAILRGCYSVLGASIPLFGGAAADGLQRHPIGPYLLGGGRVLRDAVVGITITSEAPLSIGVRHGWRKVGEPMIVTSTGNDRVYTLDDRPALDVYLNRLDAPPEAYVNSEVFTHFALPRPIGVQRRSGVSVYDVGTRVNMEERSIASGNAIDHGGLIWAMTGDEESILAAAEAACSDALAGLAEHEPVGMLTFSCCALRAILGEEGIRRESDRLAKWAAGTPFAGFHTYGEIARVRGIDGFHNQTLAVLAIS